VGTYQLMKDDLPAEWFPISNTVIFLRGAKNLMLNCSASLTSPTDKRYYTAVMTVPHPMPHAMQKHTGMLNPSTYCTTDCVYLCTHGLTIQGVLHCTQLQIWNVIVTKIKILVYGKLNLINQIFFFFGIGMKKSSVEKTFIIYSTAIMCRLFLWYTFDKPYMDIMIYHTVKKCVT
jgi:hypothetical protein